MVIAILGTLPALRARRTGHGSWTTADKTPGDSIAVAGPREARMDPGTASVPDRAAAGRWPWLWLSAAHCSWPLASGDTAGALARRSDATRNGKRILFRSEEHTSELQPH